jgi:hypothetical protein
MRGAIEMNKTKRRLVAVMVLAGVALFVGVQVLSASAGPSQATAADPFAGYVTPSGPDIPLEKVVALADARSAEAGQPDPPMSEGKGTLEAAMRTIDRSTNLTEQTSRGYRAMLATPVDLVVMQGHFTLGDALVPAGRPAPTGSVLDLVIDSHTGAVIGRALPTAEQQQEQNQGVPLAGIASRGLIAVHKVTGVIAGRLYVSGGPPRAGHGVHPADRFTVVVTRGTRTLAKTITTRRGAFSIHIAPGRYELAGEPGACRAKKVVVKAGRTTRARLYCGLL